VDTDTHESSSPIAACLREIVRVCRYYGYVGDADIATTLKHWHELAVTCGWMKVAKYKLAAFFSFHMGQPLPVPPASLPNDSPKFLVGGGAGDEGAHFGRVAAKIPVRRMPEAVERLVTLYTEQRASDTEELGAFFRRIPAVTVSDRLKDLVDLVPGEMTADDYVDLGETQAFEPVILDGECSA